MGKFKRQKESATHNPDIQFRDGVMVREGWLDSKGEPINRQESYNANRGVALAMLRAKFPYRKWMTKYLTEEEREPLGDPVPMIRRIWI